MLVLSVTRPEPGNHLPERITSRSISNVEPFKSKLKTYLFDITFGVI